MIALHIEYPQFEQMQNEAIAALDELLSEERTISRILLKLKLQYQQVGKREPQLGKDGALSLCMENIFNSAVLKPSSQTKTLRSGQNQDEEAENERCCEMNDESDLREISNRMIAGEN